MQQAFRSKFRAVDYCVLATCSVSILWIKISLICNFEIKWSLSTFLIVTELPDDAMEKVHKIKGFGLK